MKARQRIIGAIPAERQRQDAKWGADRRQPSSARHLILSEEVGEVAAVAVAMGGGLEIRHE